VVTASASEDHGTWLTRPVLLAGLALGTFVTASAVYGGARPHLTSLPFFLPLVLGVLAELLVIVAVATVLAALLRRHQRALLSGAWRHGRRGTVAAFQVSRKHGGSLRERLAQWAGPRWQRRSATSEEDTGQRDGDKDLDHDDQDDGHQAVNPPAAPAAGGSQQKGSDPMTTTTTQTTPAGWKTLTTDTADFEPDDDGELLVWMAEQVAGMLGYGEALANVHEHCVSAVRLDPAAMATLHDVADAVADAAEAMARAINRFKQVYEAPREFVADGGVLPKSGDFLTGDDG
jgi:hypothetical protein